MKIKRYTYIIICLIIVTMFIYYSVSKKSNNGEAAKGEVLYADIINQYINCVNNEKKLINDKQDFDWDLIGQDVNLQLLTNLRQYDQFSIYYAIKDLDKNGVPELLIGGAEKNGELIYYDLFTYDGKSAINPFVKLGYEFGHRTNFSVFSNGLIKIEWSNSGFNHGFDFYKISKDGYTVELVDNVSTDINAYGVTKFYHDKEGNIEISKDEFQSILNSYTGENPMPLSWTEITPKAVFANKNNEDYSISIKSFTENGSYIEYPQLEGLKDKKKQLSINAILKEQIYIGAKDYLNEPFVDFSNPDYVYKFKTEVGFKNDYIVSFLYSFDAYGITGPDDKFIQNNSRSYGVTIDVEAGKKIELSEFMAIDARLINSTDGSNLETDYNAAVRSAYHKFKDLFGVYTTEDEKDYFHSYTPQEVIENLKNPKGETEWYIDVNKNIVFLHMENYMEIPYKTLVEIIHPQYLDRLNKE